MTGYKDYAEDILRVASPLDKLAQPETAATTDFEHAGCFQIGSAQLAKQVDDRTFAFLNESQVGTIEIGIASRSRP